MKEKFMIDSATGEPFIIAESDFSVGGVEGVTLVEVTEDEFIEAAVKREHPLHKDRPTKKEKGNNGKGKK